MGAALDFICCRLRKREVTVRWTGISSDALALYGVGKGPRPRVPSDEADGDFGENFPHDEGDLLACTLTYYFAPKDVQTRMLPVLKEFEDWVWYGPRGTRKAAS